MATGKKKVVKKAVKKILTKAKPKLNFTIDKLTNSIENVKTGKSFETKVLPLTAADLKQITKLNGWQFDWKNQAKDETKMIRKLVINHPDYIKEIQGLVCITIQAGFVEMDLIESAPINYGKTKKYYGVAGNLVAYACEVSFANGFDGYVSFVAKTKLVKHYIDTLQAQNIYGDKMVIETEAAKNLVSKYFKDYFLNK